MASVEAIESLQQLSRGEATCFDDLLQDLNLLQD